MTRWRICSYNLDKEDWVFVEYKEFENTEKLDEYLCELSSRLGTATSAKIAD